MRKLLLLFCLALPLGADSQKLYRGTLGPTQTFSLALGDDKSATLELKGPGGWEMPLYLQH